MLHKYQVGNEIHGKIPYVSIVPKPEKHSTREQTANFPSEAFISLLLQKDRKAFELLYDKYSGALYGLALKMLKQEALAEDVLQEAFIKVYRKIHTYDPVKGRLFTWMLNITRNLAIDMLRSRQYQMTSGSVQMETEHLEKVAPSVSTNIDHIGLTEVLDTLPDGQREVILLLYFQGYTQVEVGKKLNIPLGTVKSKVRLGMKALRKKMLESKGDHA